MLALRLMPRVQTSALNISSQFHKLPPLLCSKAKNDSSSEEKTSSEGTSIAAKRRKNQDAIDKLNMLLKSMTEEEYIAPTSDVGKILARPPVKPKKDKSEKEEPVVVAAKKVAEDLGGDVKKTESELLNKLLASDVAKQGGEDAEKPLNLRDLIAGMKIDRSEKKEQASVEGRAQQVRRILERQKTGSITEHLPRVRDIRKREQPGVLPERVNIFGGEPLGIFKESGKEEQSTSIGPDLPTWRSLEARELRLAVTHPPSNIYEELIQWTEQGKLWHFPIDNFQGLEEEKKVYFTEHVFLEHHLEPWCPKKGPLRHFMELVCVGLSKNPYITVQMKLEHIKWFENYFESKKQLLQETGALPTASGSETTLQEQKET